MSIWWLVPCWLYNRRKCSNPDLGWNVRKIFPMGVAMRPNVVYEIIKILIWADTHKKQWGCSCNGGNPAQPQTDKVSVASFTPPSSQGMRDILSLCTCGGTLRVREALAAFPNLFIKHKRRVIWVFMVDSFLTGDRNMLFECTMWKEFAQRRRSKQKSWW